MAKTRSIMRQIQKEIAEQGLSQAELADRAGTSQPTLNHYLAGRKAPSLPVLERLVRALGYDLVMRKRGRS